MENVENKNINKDGQGAGMHEHSHSCWMCHGGGQHTMGACTWGGHHFSILRVIIGVIIIVAAFCAGAAFSEHHGEYRGDRGYGYGMHDQYMRGYGYGDVNGLNQQNMLYYHQQFLRGAGIPMMGTTTAK